MARTRKTHRRRHSRRRLRGGSLPALSPASVTAVTPGPKLHNVDVGADNQESVNWNKVKGEQGGWNVGQTGGRKRRHASRKHRRSSKKHRKSSRRHRKSHRRMSGGKTGCGC